MFIEKENTQLCEYNKIIKKNTFYTLHWQHNLRFLFFKPKGSQLANQAIVGLHFEKTSENSFIAHMQSWNMYLLTKI